ncbi:UNVERIFIED_CONTAM: hypothetical protein FKN15_022358 [Acipenser sinensis]
MMDALKNMFGDVYRGKVTDVMTVGTWIEIVSTDCEKQLPWWKDGLGCQRCND